jgi:hypothetical protein
MRRAVRRAIVVLVLSVLSVPEPALDASAQTQTERAKSRSRAKQTKETPDAKKAKSKQAAPVEARGWTMVREAGEPVLRYARATGPTLVSFFCQPDSGLIRVVAIAGPQGRGLRPGDGARIRLMSGPSRFEVAGIAFTSGPDASLFVAGTTRITPRFFSLFKTSETMNVEVPGRTTGISLKGLSQLIETFERECLDDY